MNKYHLTKGEIEAEWLIIKQSKLDTRYFAPIYNRYYKPIFLYIYKKTRDEELTSDITAQVVLIALRNLSKYENRGLPFSSFLYKIAYNEWLMFERKAKTKRFVCVEDVHLQAIAEEITEIEREERIEKILEGIKALSLEDIQFVELRFFEGLSFKEIGEIVGITENNAKVEMYRIIDKIKNNILHNRS